MYVRIYIFISLDIGSLYVYLALTKKISLGQTE